MLTGAGRGVGLILAGIAIVAAAIFIPGLGFKLAGSIVTKVGLFGGSLILTGIAQMIAPVPKPPSARETPTQLESNSFSGVVNTSRQGVPVPIAYGRVFVGSAVISAGLDVDRIQ